MTPPRLFIRTEASTRIGMGHFMRCFAIAEAARKKDIGVTFLMDSEVWGLDARCAKIGAEIERVFPFGEDLKPMRSILLPEDWLLVDSYTITEDYLCALHEVTQVAVIDDLSSLDCYNCRIIVNAAMSATQTQYIGKSQARLLLGRDYALIREEFRSHYAAVNSAAFIAVMFGGSDPTGLTGQLVRQLYKALPDLRIRVIAGPANSRLAELKSLSAELQRIDLHVSPPKVAKILAGAELILTAAGGTIGEVAAMGLPALVLVVYDNQKAALEACPYPTVDARQGLPADLPQRVAAMLADPEMLKASGRAAREVVDGRGPQRIVEAMFGV